MEKIIGKRIQQHRKEKGLTQAELAKILDVTPHYLSALERGVYNIKLETLVKILNALDCSADEIFCDVVNRSSGATLTKLSNRLESLCDSEQSKILAVVDTMLSSLNK